MIDIIFHDKTGVTPYNPGQTGGFENAAGSGEIHYYRLFDGVGIMLLRLEMETYTEIRTQIGMIEINFCINGRFETSFSVTIATSSPASAFNKLDLPTLGAPTKATVMPSARTTPRRAFARSPSSFI